MGGATLALVSGNAQTYGFWQMGGQGHERLGYPTINGSSLAPGHQSGAHKWLWTPEEGDGNAVGGCAIDDEDTAQYEYKVYFSGSDGRLYRLHIDFSGSQFTPSKDYRGSGQMVGTPIGTPVLGKANGTKAVYTVDTNRRLYCFDASNGSLIWRSEQLGSTNDVLVPPLYERCGPAEEGYRVYVPCSNGLVYAFEPTGTSDQEYVWYFSFGVGSIVRPMSAIFIEPNIGGQDLVERKWCPVLATSAGHVLCFYDYGDYPIVQWTFDSAGLYETCETWPIVGVNDYPYVRVYVATYDTNNQGRVYAIYGTSYDDSDAGDPAWLNPVTVAAEGNSNLAIGKIQANPCSSRADNVGIFFLVQDAGSGTGKPTPLVVTDLGESGSGKWGKRLPNDSDSLLSTPIFTNVDTYPVLNWGLDGGKLFAEKTTLFGLATNQQAWSPNFPVTFTNTTVPAQDLAMDRDGALVVVLGSGKIEARWGAKDNTEEED